MAAFRRPMVSFSRPPRRGPSGGRGQSFHNDDNETHRINHRITARTVRLITDTGEQRGVVPLEEALRAADDAGLDLVEVSPNAEPPVCKILDYGKFKYKEQKKEAENKKKRSESEVKEIRIRYRTDDGDLETKQRHAREFLAEGNKVKFSMMFRGREIMYQDLGEEVFKKVMEGLAEVADIDERSRQGKQIYIVFAPKKK